MGVVVSASVVALAEEAVASVAAAMVVEASVAVGAVGVGEEVVARLELEVWVEGDLVFCDRHGNRIARHRPACAMQAEATVHLAELAGGQGVVRECLLDELVAPEVKRLTYEETTGLDDHRVKLTVVQGGEWLNHVSEPLG